MLLFCYRQGQADELRFSGSHSLGDHMDISSITAAYNGLKFAKDTLSTLAQGQIAIESQSKVLAALEQVGKAQDAMFEMREELFGLQDQNRTLKLQVEQSDA